MNAVQKDHFIIDGSMWMSVGNGMMIWFGLVNDGIERCDGGYGEVFIY